MNGGDNDKTDFPHKLLLLLNDRQVLRLLRVFANNSSANKKLSKTQLLKTVLSGGFLGRTFGLLMRVGLPLMRNVVTQLANTFS